MKERNGNLNGEGSVLRGTAAVHAGEARRKPYAALTTPVVQTSAYTFENTAEVMEFMKRKEAGAAELRHEYGRYSNPTRSAAEGKLAALEGGERALLFASGMCAVTTSLLAILGWGDHLIVAGGVYRRTREFAEAFLPRFGVEATFVPHDDPASWEAAVRPATRLIYTEAPSNPTLSVADLDLLSAFAKKRGLLGAADATFATPVNLRPLEHGLDLVFHSATKYLGGHNDLLAGVVVAPAALASRLEEAQGVLGGVGSPHDAYLLLRGLKTLDLRVRRQNETGLRVASFLESHPSVSRVYYPGLPSHPDHETARRLMTGFGGVISFEVRGGLEWTSLFIDRLRLPYIGPTLGGVESVVQQQALFLSTDPEKRRRSGIADNLVRYALGVEDAEDIIADLKQALEF
ncbi:MAG: aminotransferase class I/II-fold pyridoxal phosphate-dependent enzyme [Candidatus Aminicenantes bacterium]|nr:aminotransferase class I/II-fold pyridoxal phosphate-dependent enzyme [Candidatus Aminicenantes bacterium]